MNEPISYLRSPLLEPHEDERYELPEIPPLTEDLYAHCLRAIDYAFRFGPHGLPLMGCGDWNDGMNRVGADGKGESVWLAWFLRVVLQQFIPLVESRGDAERAAAYAHEADRLLQAAEGNAWDGEWYRRAYFDDGTPLGSAQNDECQIDSLVQSWSVIAGGDPRAKPHRDASGQANGSSVATIVSFNFLDPPFDKTSLDPGYIKGYPPGIRENGGQYTHAATWFVQALTMLGKGTEAGEVFDLLNPIHSASPSGGTNYRSSRMLLPPMSTARHRTWAAAVGHGTPARPAGCIESRSNAFLGCDCAAIGSLYRHAFRRTGRASKSGFAGNRRHGHFAWKIQMEWSTA